MKRSPQELAQTERFEQSYANSQTGVMLAIERQVCGCDYGGNSWTTRTEAELIGSLLDLKPGTHFLDLGSGSGWPALYLASNSGCDLTLVDLPLTGLRIAAERVARDRLNGACRIICADAGRLPFGDGGFDALSHSDLLCCVRQKRAVLESCARVLRRDGRMVFTVISLATGLDSQQRDNALAAAPEFVESDTDYAGLLAQTGWSIKDHRDVSDTFAESSRRHVIAMRENRDSLIDLLGESEYDFRLTRSASKISAIEAGGLRRELFVAELS